MNLKQLALIVIGLIFLVGAISAEIFRSDGCVKDTRYEDEIFLQNFTDVLDWIRILDKPKVCNFGSNHSLNTMYIRALIGVDELYGCIHNYTIYGDIDPTLDIYEILYYNSSEIFETETCPETYISKVSPFKYNITIRPHNTQGAVNISVLSEEMMNSVNSYIWENYTHPYLYVEAKNQTLKKIVYNITSIVEISKPSVCDIGYDYSKNNMYYNVTRETIWNGTSGQMETEVLAACVDNIPKSKGNGAWEFSAIGTTYKAKWILKSYYDWMPLSVKSASNIEIGGKLYYHYNFQINLSNETILVPIEIIPTVDNGKFIVSVSKGFNLDMENEGQYLGYIDPYWNTSKTNRTPLFVNNVDSVDHIHEPLLYNLSGVCNDVAPAVVYNYSGTLGFYPFYNISGNANWSPSDWTPPTVDSVYLRVIVNSTAGAGIHNWGEVYCGGDPIALPPFLVFSDNFTDNRNHWNYQSTPTSINTTTTTLDIIQDGWGAGAAINMTIANGTMSFRYLYMNTTDDVYVNIGCMGYRENVGIIASSRCVIPAYTPQAPATTIISNNSQSWIATSSYLDYETSRYRFYSDGINNTLWNYNETAPHTGNLSIKWAGWAMDTSIGFETRYDEGGPVVLRAKIDDFAFVWSGLTPLVYAFTYNQSASTVTGTTEESGITNLILPKNTTYNSTSREFRVNVTGDAYASYTCNYTLNGVTNSTNFTVVNGTNYSVDWTLDLLGYNLSTTCSNQTTSTANVVFAIRQLVSWVNTSDGTTVTKSAINATNCTASILGSPLWVNFTIYNSSGYAVVNNVNGTLYADGNWSSINFTPDAIGIWSCNISVYDGTDIITNSTQFSVVGSNAPNISSINTNRGLSFVLNSDNTTYCKAIVTDADGNDTIQWVNFTVKNPASVNVISNLNGTNISESVWISQNFTPSTIGFWNCYVVAYDGLSMPNNNINFEVISSGDGGGGGGGGGGAPITITQDVLEELEPTFDELLAVLGLQQNEIAIEILTKIARAIDTVLNFLSSTLILFPTYLWIIFGLIIIIVVDAYLRRAIVTYHYVLAMLIIVLFMTFSVGGLGSRTFSANINLNIVKSTPAKLLTVAFSAMTAILAFRVKTPRDMIGVLAFGAISILLFILTFI